MRFFVQISNIRKKPHRAAKKLKKCTTAPHCCFLLLLFLCCCFLLLLFLAAVSCLCCSSLLLLAAVTLVAAAPRRWSPHCRCFPHCWFPHCWFPHCCVRRPVSLGPLSGFARRLQSPIEAGSRHTYAARVHVFLKSPWCRPALAKSQMPLFKPLGLATVTYSRRRLLLVQTWQAANL